MINATIEKFGYPHSLVEEFEHWLLLLRPSQVTLGSLVLAARSPVLSYGDLPAGAFVEQGRIIGMLEPALRRFSRFERINYLMLMMVDPHVHFHVIPRYSTPRQWRDIEFEDSGWPGPPDLKSGVVLDNDAISALVADIRSAIEPSVGSR